VLHDRPKIACESPGLLAPHGGVRLRKGQKCHSGSQKTTSQRRGKTFAKGFQTAANLIPARAEAQGVSKIFAESITSPEGAFLPPGLPIPLQERAVT
jgi:hypothetical protein